MSAISATFGQSVQSNFLNTLADDYKAFSKGTSENILGMASTVRQARGSQS